MIITITGPSGSGKTTLLKAMRKDPKFGCFPELVSNTTRESRPGEIDGVDYYFVSMDQFNNTPMVESTEYAGNKYGLSVDEVDIKFKTYDACFVIVDRNGAESLKELYKHNVFSIFIDVNEDKLKERLVARDGEEKAAARLSFMKENNENNPDYKFYDYIVSNDNGFNIALESIKRIVKLKLDNAHLGRMMFHGRS